MCQGRGGNVAEAHAGARRPHTSGSDEPSSIIPHLGAERLRAVLDGITDGLYVTDTERRILFWNRAAETITGYTARQVLGKSCADGILQHTDETGRSLCNEGCPIMATVGDGRPREADVFLHHHQGERLPVRVRALPLLDAHGKIVGAVETFSSRAEQVAALELIETLESLAYVDSLTHLPNRRYLETALESRLNELQRYGWPFGAILMDIDHFKAVNDTHGHEVGDEVLGMVARTLANTTRSFDVVGRWGGEEFLAVLTNAGRDDAARIAERFRMAVERAELATAGGLVRVTLSAGVANAGHGDTPATLLERADRLLYLSKELGRNRISTE